MLQNTQQTLFFPAINIQEKPNYAAIDDILAELPEIDDFDKNRLPQGWQQSISQLTLDLQIQAMADKLFQNLYLERNNYKQQDLLRYPTLQHTKHGFVYQGTWKYGKRHGLGKMRCLDGSIYVGNWSNDKVNGQGRMILPNGNIYQGNWKNGQAEGFGKFFYKKALKKYEGFWKNDQYEGVGKITFSGGEVFLGRFKEGVMDGFGEYWYKDGSMYQGYFLNDKRNGWGRYFHANGVVEEGNWVNGKLHDTNAILWYERGKIFQGAVIQGRQKTGKIWDTLNGMGLVEENHISNRMNSYIFTEDMLPEVVECEFQSEQNNSENFQTIDLQK